MKISIKGTLYSAVAAALLSGCGGGSTTLDEAVDTIPAVSKKSTTIQASDAYVISLVTAATLKVDGKEFNSTKVDANGTITFEVPEDLNLSNAEIHIPADAIVDADGDGKLSNKDQTIRMALKARGEGAVANPLATVALENNDIEAYKHFKNFDPVKAKEELIKNPNNEKLKALVVVSDAIATLLKEAKEANATDEDIKIVLKNIKLDEVKKVVKSNSQVDVETLTISTIDEAASKAEVDEDKVVNKTKEVVDVIEEVHSAINRGKIKSHKDGLKAIIAVSDADVNKAVIDKAIEDGNITEIKNHIKEDEKVKKHKEKKDKEHNGKNGLGGLLPGKGGDNGNHKDNNNKQDNNNHNGERPGNGMNGGNHQGNTNKEDNSTRPGSGIGSHSGNTGSMPGYGGHNGGFPGKGGNGNRDNNGTQYGNGNCDNGLIDSNKTENLTQELKDSLAYMGNEERLAYDVYMNLYKYHKDNNNLDITPLYNIATRSESRHISIVQSIVQKYDLNVTDFSNVDRDIVDSNNMSPENMPSGIYDVPKIQELYNQLYSLGQKSHEDALKVGCMVEVTDINDLDEYIRQAEEANATDIKEAFEILRKGSYNHYWAFDQALKNIGIENGCYYEGDPLLTNKKGIYPKNNHNNNEEANTRPGNGKGQGNNHQGGMSGDNNATHNQGQAQGNHQQGNDNNSSHSQGQGNMGGNHNGNSNEQDNNNHNGERPENGMNGGNHQGGIKNNNSNNIQNERVSYNRDNNYNRNNK